MKRALPAILVALVAVLTVIGCATPGKIALRVHSTAVRLVMDDGSCSGTIIGPHAILSATHCFTATRSLAVDDRPVTVTGVVSDGRDHTIVYVTQLFRDFAVVAGEPQQTEEVFVFGNPGGLQDMYRVGYVAGTIDSDSIKVTLYDLNGYFGDSGSGVFDSSGHLVAVISQIIYESQGGASQKYMASFPLHFTATQLEQAQSQEGQPRA
jgi:V8-like Glu-specific endopeptidase